MYYSSGSCKHLRPKSRRALIINPHISSVFRPDPLTAACYLVRDGQMKGEHVHVFEGGPAQQLPATATSTASATSCAAAVRWTTIFEVM